MRELDQAMHLALRMPKADYDELRRNADRLDRTVSWIVRQAISQWLRRRKEAAAE